eukprot:g10854.t1
MPVQTSTLQMQLPVQPQTIPVEAGEDAFGNRDMVSETVTDLTDRYVMQDKLGEGTYGTVYRAKCKQSHRQDGVPAVALREISLLKELSNKHVVKLLDVYSSPSNLYLVFERMEMDLRVYLKRNGQMEPATLRTGLYNVPLKVYTHDIVTLWYRPPEILLGQEQYGPSTDIWSMSCIFAEMATAHALFTGDSDPLQSERSDVWW